jgi:hypothetical protein
LYDKSDTLGLSSCFILLGSCLLYLNFGITNLDGIYVLSSLSEVNGLESLVETNKYFNLALLVMSVGYLFKVSAAPAVWCRKSPLWVKLSNSGDLLKLIIPSYIWKNISGWSNYSGKVISYKMNENEMDNRGSKSVVVSTLENAIVKEQRVYGSWYGCFIAPCLRYTLTGSERNYQIKILSNQIIGVIILLLFSPEVNLTDSLLALGVTPLLTYTNSDLDNKENMSWFFTGLIDASIPKKSVIVWGTNLQSTVGVKFTKKRIINGRTTFLSKECYNRSIIVGWLTNIQF